MRALGEFRRRGGRSERRFTNAERRMIRNLASGLIDTMAAAGDPAAAQDPVLVRLLPDAAPHDRAASAEFAAAVRDRLAAAKAEGAHRLVTDLDAAPDGVVRLDADAAAAWLRTLGDLRLALAERVGVEEVQRSVRSPHGLVYAWLTWLQGSLVDSLDGG